MSVCKVVYFGSDRFSCGILEMLLASNVCNVVQVVTTPLKRVGRGLREVPNDIARLCSERGISYLAPEKLNDPVVDSVLKDANADLFIVVSYGKILPAAMLSIPKFATLNVHPSLLPRWRGPSPIQTALLNGDRETGVSIITLTPEIDAGDVIMQERVPLDDDINAIALEDALMRCGGRMLSASVMDVMHGAYTKVPQDVGKVTVARKLTKSDGLILWERTARDIHNQVRALCEWPTSYTYMSGKMVKLFETKVSGAVSGAVSLPGAIIEISKKGFITVATGDGILELYQVQVEGKRRMDAFSFSLGMRLQPGDVFSKEGGA